MEIIVTEKKCSKCHKVKSLDSFSIKNYNKDGLDHYCKECDRSRSKKYYARPEIKEHKKYYLIEKNYGLTKEQYLMMLEKQNHQCTICCAKLNNDNKTHIDHCHITGNIRDVLCYNCNQILGKVNEDINYLNNLITYINKYKQ